MKGKQQRRFIILAIWLCLAIGLLWQPRPAAAQEAVAPAAVADSSAVQVLRDGSAYFLKIDLRDSRVHPVATLANNNGGGYQTLSGIAGQFSGRGYADWAVINADLFGGGCPGGTNCGQGLTYTSGQRRDNWSAYGSTWQVRGNLGFDGGNNVEINMGDGQGKRHMTVAGGPRIVMGGGAPTCSGQLITVGGATKTLFPASGEQFDGDVRGWCSDTRAITLAGYSGDGRYLFVGVSGGGRNVLQLADWLKGQGAHEILRFDSGGSSGMIHNGNLVAGASSRAIATALAVVVDAGSAPPPPPPGGSWAFQIFSLGDYNGEKYEGNQTISDLASIGKNDWAESMKVAAGYGIVACTDSDFRGTCGRAVGPAAFSDINALAQGLRRGLSSIQVCNGACPQPPPPPEPNCDGVSSGVPMLFDDRDCHGERRSYDAGFSNLGDFGDRATAVFVPAGWSVRLFEHGDAGGRTRCATGSMWNFAVDRYDASDGLIDNTVSSIEVYRNANCALPLQVVEALTLAPAQPMAGEPVTARYTLKNLGGRTLNLRGLGVIARGPACTRDWECVPSVDFPVHENVVLPPGGQYTYTGVRNFEGAGGGYFAVPGFADANWWWYKTPGTPNLDFAVQPGLEVVEELTLDPPQPLTGEPVTARFKVRNAGPRAIHLQRIHPATRGPDCTDWSCPRGRDFPWRNDVTIAPGELFSYEGVSTFLATGQGYFAELHYKFGDDDWHFLGRRVTLAVAQGVRVVEPLQLTPAAPMAGEGVTARFTLRNDGGRTITLHSVGVVARGPDCTAGWACETHVGFLNRDGIVLAPGQRYTYTSTRAFETPGGGYFAEAAFADGNWWWYPAPEGERVPFAVASGLEVAEDLALGPLEPQAGEALTARFALRNAGSRPLRLMRLMVATRGPDCDDWACPRGQDFEWHNDITIAPGDVYRYEQRRSFRVPGEGYFAQILYKTAEEDWHFAGGRRDFAVGEGLVMVEGLALTPAVAGAPVTATYTIRNDGMRALTLQGLGVVARGPGCTEDWSCTPVLDFPVESQVTLAPGARYSYRGVRSFATAGEHFAEPAFADGNWWWYALPGSQRLTFAVGAGQAPPSPPPAPVQPTLTISTGTGAPGSYFVLLGHGFAPDSQVPLYINGAFLVQIPTDGSGRFVLVIVTTTDTPAGRYTVTSTVAAATPADFYLTRNADLVQEGGGGTQVTVPPNTAPAKSLYLPAVWR